MTDPRELAETESKPIALAWIDRGISILEGDLSELALAALRTAFRWDRVDPGRREAYALRVQTVLELARDVIAESERRFRSASEEEARRVFPGADSLPPAYAVFGDAIYFTPTFAGFGPLCRAAMVVHESVHVIDPRSGEAEIHISEWDEPRFSALEPEQAIHNPSAYACFVAQVHEGRLEWPPAARFGAGNAAI